jgi:hypothetical protein
MARHSPTNLNLDTISRSQSASSLRSNATIGSNRSTTGSTYSTASGRRGRGLLSKLGTGFQSIFRRISRAHTSLTEMEIHILVATTNFNREEVLQW